MMEAPSHILDLLDRLAEREPGRVVLEQPGSPDVSRGDLRRLALSVARGLAEAFPAGRPRVGMVIPNGTTMAVTLLGVAVAGVALPFNPSYTEPEFRAYFRDTRVDLLLLPAEGQDLAAAAARSMGIRVLRLSPDGGLAGTRGDGPVPSPAPDDVALVLLTSGSTGRAKSVPLTHRNVCASARDVAASMSLGSSDRCLAMWEQYHVGGLVDLLLAPLVSGGVVICTPGFRTDEALRLLAEARPTWFQVVPTTLGDLVAQVRRDGRGRPGGSLRLLRSVAAALPPRLMAEAEETFSVPVLQTFGMTEAGPLITSTLPPPAPRKPGSVGRSCGCEIRIVDSGWGALPPGQTGQVAIRGPNVFSGYEDDAAANAAQFRDGWFLTGDLGRLDPEGDLFLVGRLKQLINRGGEKVNPQEVDDALLTHPAVAEAASFPVPHPTLGEDVAAAVVLRSPADPGELRAHLLGHLAAFKVPGRIDVRRSLPRNAVGKVDRLELACLVAARPAASGEPSRDADPLERRLALVWARELGRVSVGPDDDFSALGGDSLSAVRLLVAVERELAVRIPRERVAGLRTVRQMARCLAESGTGRLAPRHPSPLDAESVLALEAVNDLAGLRVHAAAATVSVLRSEGSRIPLIWCYNGPRQMTKMAEALGADQPLFGFYSGGKALSNDPGFLDCLAEHHAADILRAFPAGPIVLGGNCKGGWVAARVARILRARGRLLDGLCLVEYADPDLADEPFRQILVFGRQSKFRAYEGIGLTPLGPSVAFRRPPEVAWIEGEHGHFYEPGNLADLACVVGAFIDHAAVPVDNDSRQTAWILRVHQSWLLGTMQRKSYRWRRRIRRALDCLRGRGDSWRVGE